LLWLNLMTDGMLGLSLGAEPAERGVMNRRPVDPKAGVFADGLGRHTIVTGITIGTIGLGVAFWYHEAGDPAWQTMLFTTLAVLQVVQAFAVRSHQQSVFESKLFDNRLMNIIVPSVLVLQLAAVSLPGLSDEVLGTAALELSDWLVAGISGLLFLTVAELSKWWRRKGAN
jgi:Ca2+-transporting ATPase